MNFVSLLANIGGNLGLFLGVSVFSLCEIVEIFIEIFFIKKIQTQNDNVIHVSVKPNLN